MDEQDRVAAGACETSGDAAVLRHHSVGHGVGAAAGHAAAGGALSDVVVEWGRNTMKTASEVESEFRSELQALLDKWGAYLFSETETPTEERVAVRLYARIANEAGHRGQSELVISKPFVPGFVSRVRLINDQGLTVR